MSAAEFIARAVVIGVPVCFVVFVATLTFLTTRPGAEERRQRILRWWRS